MAAAARRRPAAAAPAAAPLLGPPPETVDLPLVADTWVATGAPAVNFHTYAVLTSRPTGLDNILLTFDRSLLPADAVVVEASLQVRSVTNASGQLRKKMSVVNVTPFNSATVTGAHALAGTLQFYNPGPEVDVPLGPVDMTLDVTAQVAAWGAGDSQLAVQTSGPAGRTNIAALESWPPGQAAVLTITYTPNPAEWLDLTILHTNDYHARVDEYNRNGARCQPADAAAGNCIGGAPRLATVVNEVRAAKSNVLLLDAGDQFQGTLFYNVFRGDVLNETMNYLGYDAMTIGNHEFDNGPGVLASFIVSATFPVVSANIDASADADLNGKIAPYTVLTVGGHEVGVIGLTTPETSNISSPGPNITFQDPATSVQAAADELMGMGVNKIIVLTHLGYDVDVALASQVSGVDVIVGGHSHSFLYNPTDPISFTPPTFPQFGPLVPVGSYPTVVQSLTAEPVLVVTAYQWGTFVGNLDVGFDPAGLVHEYGGNPIFLGSNVAKDAALDALLDPYRAAVAGLIATPVGETTVDLLIVDGGQQICRLGECLMGNLVADAMLAKANEMEPGANYQIAFQNGGGLRAPLMTGPISMGDVLETLPFGNAIATFELKGEYVKAALENGASRYPSANGGFAQVAGMRYVIDPAQAVGARIVQAEVWDGAAWQPLDMDAMYKVVTNDFMRRGGDNYLMFRDFAVNPYDFGPALDEALADYFGAHSPVTPVLEGRVSFPQQWLDMTLLHTNDYHARVDEYNRSGARCQPADAGGGELHWRRAAVGDSRE